MTELLATEHKREIDREPFQVPLHGLIESAGRHTIDGSQLGIERHLLLRMVKIRSPGFFAGDLELMVGRAGYPM
jgi:hypothetical protein